MKSWNFVALAAVAALAGCTTSGADGGASSMHAPYQISDQEREFVVTALETKFGASGIQLEGTKGSQHVGSGMVVYCGYASGTGLARTAFGGIFGPNRAHTTFLPFAETEAKIKSLCRTNDIYI